MDTKRIAVDDEPPLQNPFADLPEDTISEIISRTTPLDVSRFAVISKGFKSSADSDTVWKRFVPTDILARSDSHLVYTSIKELYFKLCDSPILFDGGKMSMYPEKKTAKRCIMVGARNLVIAAGDNPDAWEWTSDPESRISEVAKLKSICWLDIRGGIETRMLSPKTFYGAYLVFKLTYTANGLELAESVIRFVNRETDLDVEDKAILIHLCRGRSGYRIPAPRQPGLHAITRADGWKEIELGSFYNDRGEDGEVEARFMEILRLHRKSGLIVQGIEFRYKTTPSYIEHWKIR